MRKPNYDKRPIIAIPDSQGNCVSGWNAIADRLHQHVSTLNDKTVIVVECYTGVFEGQVLEHLSSRLAPAAVIDSRDALLPESSINSLVEPYLGDGDPVFGFLSDLTLPQFFDSQLLKLLRAYPSTEPIVKCVRREGSFSGFFSLHGGAHDVTTTEPLRMAFAR